jgi:hypothetical protein
MNNTPPLHTLTQHDGLAGPELEHQLTNPTQQATNNTDPAAATAAVAALGPDMPSADEVDAMAAAATATMVAAMQQAAAATAQKRKKPSAAAAAGGSGGGAKQGPKKGKGVPSLPLKTGLCSFCQETHSPMWRKGPEQYPRLCNRCGMRYSRNKNDLPKAFSVKVMARIQAERQKSGGQVRGQGSCHAVWSDQCEPDPASLRCMFDVGSAAAVQLGSAYQHLCSLVLDWALLIISTVSTRCTVLVPTVRGMQLHNRDKLNS